MTPEDPRPTLPYHRHDTPPGSDGTFPPDANSFLGKLGLRPGDTANADTAFVVGHPGAAEPVVPGFDLLGELGVGGMGIVYKAREVALNRVVAVKMIRPDARPGARDVARFRAEAEAVAAVRHPNVVEVYSTGVAGGLPYFVMEYVAGGSLARRLQAGPLAPAEAAAVVAAVARGVHAAHAAGIVHRDLKPGNVLLQGARSEGQGASTDGGRPSSLAPCPSPLAPPTPKVSDFGLAKRLAAVGDGLTKTVAVIGTPAYMAPEQARGNGKFVGPEADVYALGVVLYECLVGRPPFADEDVFVLMRRVADEAPAPPRGVVAAVPRDLDLICRKCLAKEARDRYATAADLAADLDRFLAGRPVAARPVPWPARAARWVRRNPAPAALAALLALLLTLGPALAVWLRAERQVSAASAVAREEALKRAEEQARREAEGRAAAEKLAAARELVGLQGVVRRREADRPAGWTWANRADLRKGAALAGGDPVALAALRTEAATALLAADLRPAGAVVPGFSSGAAAASPDGRLVALGEFNAWNPDVLLGGLLGNRVAKAVPLNVVLVDPATGAVARRFGVEPGRVVRDGKPAPDRVTCLAFAPDGRRVFAGTRSARVVRFDLDGPDEAAAAWATPTQLDHLAVTADGTGVVGQCGPVMVRWDAATGAEAARVEAGSKFYGLAVEPGTGDLVVAVGTAVARTPPAAPALPPPPTDPNLRWASLPVVLPGGALVAVARETTVELRAAADLRPVGRLTDPDLLGQAAHSAEIEAMAAHPSGAYLATASASREVKVWAVASGRRVASVQVPGTGPAALAWSGDGRFLVVTGPGQAARYEFGAPAAERVAGVHPYPLAAAVPDRGGAVVALGGVHRAPDPVQALFRAGADGRVGAVLRLPRATESDADRAGLAVNPRTGVVAVAGLAEGVVLWDPARPDAVEPLDPLVKLPARCPAFAPAGREAWAVVDSSRVRAWDAGVGTPLGPGWANGTGAIVVGPPALEALAVGRGVGVAGGADGAVHVLDAAAAGRVGFFPGGRDPVVAVALAPAEDVAAAGTQGGKLRLVRLAGEPGELPVVADAHPGGVTAVSFSADGAVLATGGRDRAVRFWARGAGGRYEPAAAVTGLPAPVRSLAFAPDGGGLVVLLAGERAARVWDAARLRAELAELGLDW